MTVSRGHTLERWRARGSIFSRTMRNKRTAPPYFYTIGHTQNTGNESLRPNWTPTLTRAAPRQRNPLSGAPGARFAARMLTVRRLTGLHASIKESGARPKNRCINSNMHLTNISHARADRVHNQRKACDGIEDSADTGSFDYCSHVHT